MLRDSPQLLNSKTLWAMNLFQVDLLILHCLILSIFYGIYIYMKPVNRKRVCYNYGSECYTTSTFFLESSFF